MAAEVTNIEGNGLLADVTDWLLHERSIESAVLFGSAAMLDFGAKDGQIPFDLDLHLITRRPADLECIDWTATLPRQKFKFQATRPATGGVYKTTVIFGIGQMDLIIVPSYKARIARFMLGSTLYRRSRSSTIGLNEMATCLQSGYRFLKGAPSWQSFYARVHSEMSGVRLSNIEARQLADAAIIDFIWVLKKIEMGELIAAQHALHRQISETNLRIYREYRLRQHLPLPSFGLGRKIEANASAEHLHLLQLSARLERDELIRAANNAITGLKTLMADIDPSWEPPRLASEFFSPMVF